MARKRIEIALPTTPFTTETLKDQNPLVSDSVITGRLNEWLETGRVRLAGKKRNEVAQRKAWFLYEPVNPEN